MTILKEKSTLFELELVKFYDCSNFIRPLLGVTPMCVFHTFLDVI